MILLNSVISPQSDQRENLEKAENHQIYIVPKKVSFATQCSVVLHETAAVMYWVSWHV